MYVCTYVCNVEEHFCTHKITMAEKTASKESNLKRNIGSHGTLLE